MNDLRRKYLEAMKAYERAIVDLAESDSPYAKIMCQLSERVDTSECDPIGVNDIERANATDEE